MGLTEIVGILGISWMTMGAIILLNRIKNGPTVEIGATAAYATGYALAEDNIRLYYAMYETLPSKPWMKKASLSVLNTRDKMLAFNASKE